MWTIMVWLYDFQARYSAYPGMVMAALTLASVPTLLVFLFCQRIIDLPPQMYPHPELGCGCEFRFDDDRCGWPIC